MTDFSLYLKLGFQHITDLTAYDHILFLVALCAIYKLSQWKSVLILITAFTIGHSVSLILASLDVFNIRTDIVEFLIPVTILLTCIYNYTQNDKLGDNPKLTVKYIMALLFGLIHGLGFSGYLRETIGALLKEEFNVVQPLLGFNIGLELGQILIVLIILGISFAAMNLFKVKQRNWNIAVSSIAILISLKLLIETKFW